MNTQKIKPAHRLGRPPGPEFYGQSEPVASEARTIKVTVDTPELTVVEIRQQPIQVVDFYRSHP